MHGIGVLEFLIIRWDYMGTEAKKLKSFEFMLAVDQLDTGFALYHEDFTLIFANKALRDFFPELFKHLDQGVPYKDCIHAQVGKVMANNSAAECTAMTNKIYNAMLNSESLTNIASGDRRVISSYKKTKNGKIVGVCMDVTEKYDQHIALAKAEKAADAANQAKSEFLASMSHEIRSPLSAIHTGAQILQQRLAADNNSQLKDFADIVVSSSSHLMELINDVLDISKIEAGKVNIHTAEYDLRTLLRDIHKSFLPTANKKNLTLKIVIDPTLPDSLEFDSLRVRQCVSNLISNALKFTAEGTVTIAVKHDASQMGKVHVADTGIGIAVDKRSCLFEKFSQAEDDTSRIYGGTGLGLSISQHLARLMGGDITVVSQLGRGSVFTLTFEAAEVCQAPQYARLAS